MTGSGGLLDQEEVDFLLREDSGPDGFGESDTRTVGEVTIRGDLQKMPLTEVCQTAGLSKMEGFLRVRNLLEQRELHFRDGHVRCLVNSRTETRRLGQRLVRAGVLSANSLRSALLIQKRSRQHLGLILVDEGVIDQATIERIVAEQVEEDLYSLFTWQQGTFELYKGASPSSDTRRRLELVPEFELSGVLLEVARRIDEWERISSLVPNMDDVYVRVEAADPAQLPGEDERRLFAALDGRHSVRDAAEDTLLGLFDTGRALLGLLEAGAARIATPEEGARAAAQMQQAGEVRKATVTVDAIVGREQPIPCDLAIELVDIVERCGESRRAADLALRLSQRGDAIEESLALARKAREFAPRMLDAIRLVHALLSKLPDTDPAELDQLSSDLADALADEGAHEEALSVIDTLSPASLEQPATISKRARVLAKLGRTDEAVESLLGLAETFKAAKDREKLAVVYEQILKVDYRRKDIARELKALHAGRFARHATKIAVGVGVVAVLAIGGWQLQGYRAARALEELRTTVLERLQEGDIDGALTLVTAARDSHGESDDIRELRTRVDVALEDRRRAAQESQAAALATRVAGCREILGRGELHAALQAFAALTEVGASIDETERVARKHLVELMPRLAKLRADLPGQLPDPPHVLQTHDEQQRIVTAVDAAFLETDLRLCRELIEESEGGKLRTLLGEAKSNEMVEAATEVRALIERARELRAAYAAKLDRTEVAQRLTPLFEAAREHEAAFRFAEALQSYRRLAAEHPEDDDLKRHFREQVERFSAIIRHLDVIARATDDGDFPTAQGQLRSLAQTYPDIPFGEFAELPVRIETLPAGARVVVDGQEVGRSPCIARYRPAATTEVRVELQGFFAERTVLNGDDVGLVRSLLAAAPDWSVTTESQIERQPVADAAGRLFAVDRAGIVFGFELRTGKELWRYDTNDLSGLLPTPALAGDDSLVVASLDGRLLCLERTSGKVRWEVDGLPAEAAPIVAGSVVAVATTDGRIVGIHANSGAKRWTRELPDGVRADPIRHRETIYLATESGRAMAIRATDGKTVFEYDLGHGVVSRPTLAGSAVAYTSFDGVVVVLDARTGQALWRKDGLGELTIPALAVGDRLVVAEGRKLMVFALADGGQRASTEFAEIVATPPTFHGDTLFVGERSGDVHALDPDSLAPRFRLHGDGQPTSPLLPIEGGVGVQAFADRTLQGFLAPR